MNATLGIDERYMVNLALGQSRILAMIAAGASLRETLDALLIFLERDVPEMACSILLIDADGTCLHPCSAPSLPEEYSRSIDGAPIGPSSGSCGTAAWRREQVVVTDIATDPLWANYREFALSHGLRACWSTPIFDDVEGRVLGTFAMYFREPCSPDARHQRLVETAQHVAAVAIIHEQRESEQRRILAALRESEERYRLINLATKDAVWDWDLVANTLWWGGGIQSLFGYPRSEVSDRLEWWEQHVHPDDRERTCESLRATAEGAVNSWSEDYRFRRHDGSYAEVQDRGYVMRDGNGRALRMIGMMQDITARKEAEARMLELASHDPVTGLSNRAALHAQLAEAVSAGKPLALLLLDLNNFGEINHTLGHQNGDMLLRHLAEILRVIALPNGRVAALGGDEFAILVAPAGSDEIAVTLEKIRIVLQKPVQLAGIPISIEATLGIAVYPQHGLSAEQLWQRADIALREAKNHGETHQFYNPALDYHDPVRLSLLGELREAIEANQIVLHYQPKVNLRTNRVSGLEALVRWQHPQRGLLYPDAFLPLAEGTGLIHPLTACILRKALKDGLALIRDGLIGELAVNLSARNLHDPAFCQQVLELVKQAGFPPTRLTLEVTETAIMDDPARARALLASLTSAGIHVAMDDFGIGHSSLAYLKDLPFDKLKIDKSFIMDFTQPRNAAIVRSAIELARNLGLQVTAEGVEDERAAVVLRDMGCDVGQGYFFSKPLSLENLVPWLRASALRPALSSVASLGAAVPPPPSMP